MYSTIVLHANLQYAEIPVSEIPEVVNHSYIPVLKALLETPKVEVVLNFSGVRRDLTRFFEKDWTEKRFETTQSFNFPNIEAAVAAYRSREKVKPLTGEPEEGGWQARRRWPGLKPKRCY